MLVAGLVLLSHVARLVPHAVAVFDPGRREAPGHVVAMLAGSPALLMVTSVNTESQHLSGSIFYLNSQKHSHEWWNFNIVIK